MRLNKCERDAIIRRIKNEIMRINNEKKEEILANFQPTEEYKTAEALFYSAVENCTTIHRMVKSSGVSSLSSDITDLSELNRSSRKRFEDMYGITEFKLRISGYKPIPVPDSSVLEDEIILSSSSDCQLLIQQLLEKYVK